MTATINMKRNLAPNLLDVDYAASEIIAMNSGHYVRFAEDKPVLRLYKFTYSSFWYWIVWLADLTLLLLPSIEEPKFWSDVPRWVAILIEIIALSILFLSFCLSMHLQDPKRLVKEAVYPYIFLAVFLLTVIDLITYYPLVYNEHSTIRWSRALRVLFPFALQSGQHIRRVVRNILRTLPNIGNVMFLFLASLLMFTLIGVGILKNRALKYPNGAPYFTDYFDTAWDLYVLTTTANNPDVMMPAFNESMLYVVFFVCYLLINLYIFINLLLAVIFSNYKQHLQDEQKIIQERQMRILETIYRRLLSRETSASTINHETFTRLIKTIRPDATDFLIEAYWTTLGIRNQSDGLNFEKFKELIFNLNFDLRQRSTDQTYFQRVFPTIYNSKGSRMIIDFVNTSLFRGIINILIIGNAVCLGVNYNDLEWFFLVAFSVEALLKIYAIGVNEYFHHRWNLFDFTIIFVSMAYSLLSTFVPHLSLNRDVLDAILVVRILRLVKLVGNVERFKAIFTTLSKVIPTLMTYLRVMFMTYYVFSMIGMELFQGKIQYSDDQTTLGLSCNNLALNNSEFARSQYCRNNFNDYFSSLIILFELTVVNQWHILASGFVLVTSKAARLFFLAFHLTAVIVVLNIFAAFVIDSFLTQYFLNRTNEFPWTRQENLVSQRLNEKGYRVIRRNQINADDQNASKKSFDCRSFCSSLIKPSVYRRMTIVLQTMNEDERAILVRWSGHVDVDSATLAILTEEKNQSN